MRHGAGDIIIVIVNIPAKTNNPIAKDKESAFSMWTTLHSTHNTPSAPIVGLAERLCLLIKRSPTVTLYRKAVRYSGNLCKHIRVNQEKELAEQQQWRGGEGRSPSEPEKLH